MQAAAVDLETLKQRIADPGFTKLTDSEKVTFRLCVRGSRNDALLSLVCKRSCAFKDVGLLVQGLGDGPHLLPRCKASGTALKAMLVVACRKCRSERRSLLPVIVWDIIRLGLDSKCPVTEAAAIDLASMQLWTAVPEPMAQYLACRVLIEEGEERARRSVDVAVALLHLVLACVPQFARVFVKSGCSKDELRHAAVAIVATTLFAHLSSGNAAVVTEVLHVCKEMPGGLPSVRLQEALLANGNWRRLCQHPLEGLRSLICFNAQRVFLNGLSMKLFTEPKSPDWVVDAWARILTTSPWFLTRAWMNASLETVSWLGEAVLLRRVALSKQASADVDVAVVDSFYDADADADADADTDAQAEADPDAVVLTAEQATQCLDTVHKSFCKRLTECRLPENGGALWARMVWPAVSITWAGCHWYGQYVDVAMGLLGEAVYMSNKFFVKKPKAVYMVMDAFRSSTATCLGTVATCEGTVLCARNGLVSLSLCDKTKLRSTFQGAVVAWVQAMAADNFAGLFVHNSVDVLVNFAWALQRLDDPTGLFGLRVLNSMLQRIAEQRLLYTSLINAICQVAHLLCEDSHSFHLPEQACLVLSIMVRASWPLLRSYGYINGFCTASLTRLRHEYDKPSRVFPREVFVDPTDNVRNEQLYCLMALAKISEQHPWRKELIPSISSRLPVCIHPSIDVQCQLVRIFSFGNNIPFFLMIFFFKFFLLLFS